MEISLSQIYKLKYQGSQKSLVHCCFQFSSLQSVPSNKIVLIQQENFHRSAAWLINITSVERSSPEEHIMKMKHIDVELGLWPSPISLPGIAKANKVK